VRSAFLICAVAFVALALAGCEGGTANQEIVVNGSTTILPIAEQAAEEFHADHPEARVLGMGSSAGIEAVSAGTADVGTSSRDLKPEEEGGGLVDTPIAYDGIAVIVSPDNPVDGLTAQQLRDIFSGTVTNWKQVGGEDRPINLVNRDEASGTREAFKKIVMGEDATFDTGAVILPGTGQVREVVSRTPGAIGYISVGFVEPRFTDSRVKALAVDGVAASEANVASGAYPIARTLHFFTNGEPQGLAKRYIEYVLSDEVQAGAVVEAGFVPVKEAKR